MICLTSNLIVDIAGFMLQYYHDNKPVWSSKVMVGKPFHQTPIFRSAITYIVLNPTWTPTPDIVKNETVPSIVKDPDFLAQQRLRVLDSSGTEIDPQHYSLETVPGKVSALYPAPGFGQGQLAGPDQVYVS
jgi:L,D-transpeptidase YcbB